MKDHKDEISIWTESYNVFVYDHAWDVHDISSA